MCLFSVTYSWLVYLGLHCDRRSASPCYIEWKSNLMLKMPLSRKSLSENDFHCVDIIYCIYIIVTFCKICLISYIWVLEVLYGDLYWNALWKKLTLNVVKWKPTSYDGKSFQKHVFILHNKYVCILTLWQTQLILFFSLCGQNLDYWFHVEIILTACNW